MRIKSQLKQDYRLCYDRYGSYARKRQRGKVRASVAVAAVLGALSVLYFQNPFGYGGSGTLTDRRGGQEAIELGLALPSGVQSVSPIDYFDVRTTPYATFSPRGDISNPEIWQTISVVAGDNLSLIFSRLGLSKKNLHEILDSGPTASSLKDLRPGQEIRFRVEEGQLAEMIHDVDLETALHVTRDDNAFSSRLLETKPDRRIATATATIEDSLFVAGQKAGLSDNVLMQLIDIFGWDIDFVLDIRVGDHYSVVYEELYKDGEKVKDGRVMAAEFVNQNRKLRAVYFVDANNQSDYYADNGTRMRKAFLRTPVNFTRISSNFNLQRRHPVLNTIRAHRGVDYAAPHGTPIKATANGKVLSVGTSGGYGKAVKLQHGGSIATLYAHMSRFARGLKSGDSIKQGQTIGYVGQTGLATGPHLHYEFLVNGAHRNPLTVELPKAEPIPNEMIDEFRNRTGPLLAQLDSLANDRARGSMIASRKTVGIPIP